MKGDGVRHNRADFSSALMTPGCRAAPGVFCWRRLAFVVGVVFLSRALRGAETAFDAKL